MNHANLRAIKDIKDEYPPGFFLDHASAETRRILGLFNLDGQFSAKLEEVEKLQENIKNFDYKQYQELIELFSIKNKINDLTNEYKKIANSLK